MAEADLKRPPRARPGRPSKQDSARIDVRILDAAWHVFIDAGYTGASMEAIAERAGVTRATLYQRHADKLSLFRAALTQRGEGWSKIAGGMDWLEGDTLETRLKNYSRMMLGWSQNSEISASRRLSESMRGEAGPLAHELEQSFRRRIIHLLTDDIAANAQREDIAVRDPRMLAILIIGALETLIGEANREGHDLDWMIVSGADAVDILLRGSTAAAQPEAALAASSRR